MARFTHPGIGDGSGTPGPQGEPGPAGADGAAGADFGIYYLGNYNPSNGYLPDIAVVRGSDGQLYLAKASGQLGDPIDYQTNGQWEIWIPKGADGSDGADGTNGADAIWNFTGAYNGGASYAVGYVATYNGQTWYRVNSNGGNVGDTPSEGLWTLIAAKGDQGIQGAQGVQGPSGNSFTVLGSYADLTAFNAGAGGEPGTLGDAYILLSDGSLMVYGAEGWFDSGDLQGPQGIQGEQGLKGDTGATGAVGGFGSYGSWYDTQTQIVTTVSTGEPVKIRQEDIVSGFTRTNNSRITATNAGIYNLAFSFQFHNEGGGGNGQTVEIWLTKNGQAVADSNTRIAVNTNSPYVVAAWNFFQQMNAGDYLEIYWATDNKNVVMKTNTGAMGGPSIPSAIITVNQVG